MSSSVLTWGTDPGSTPLLASERLRRARALAPRDVELPDLPRRDRRSSASTRRSCTRAARRAWIPATWADLGWLTCFAGPPASAVDAMRDAVSAEHLNQYSPDLIEPLRDAAAGVLGRARDDDFEVIGTEGAQAGIALSLMAVAGPGDEVILSDPGLLPRAVGGHRHRRRAGHGRRSTRATAFASIPTSSPRRSRRARGRSSSSTRSTRSAPSRPRDELAALARLADEHDLLLIHDVTHGSLVIDPDVPFASLPALELTDNAVATFSVSHCYGMAGARIGFLAGPSRLMRSCLRLKAALTRLNTSLIAQHGALAALRDEHYLDAAQGDRARQPRPPARRRSPASTGSS